MKRQKEKAGKKKHFNERGKNASIPTLGFRYYIFYLKHNCLISFQILIFLRWLSCRTCCSLPTGQRTEGERVNSRQQQGQRKASGTRRDKAQVTLSLTLLEAEARLGSDFPEAGTSHKTSGSFTACTEFHAIWRMEVTLQDHRIY